MKDFILKAITLTLTKNTLLKMNKKSRWLQDSTTLRKFAGYHFIAVLLLLSASAFAQSDQHYTMFMYNKMLYNPAYAGSRDVVSANALYRRQWMQINRSPAV